MSEVKAPEIPFVTGSQHLYGPVTLAKASCCSYDVAAET